MELKQIEAFYQVVMLRSFSKAAQKLYLTQPTVSSHIMALENELGAKLLIRSTKMVLPTNAGKVFFEYAQNIVHLKERAHFAIREDASKRAGQIELLASSVPAQYILPEILPLFHRDYPNIFFSIHQSDSAGVLESLITQDIELGLIGCATENRDFVCEAFMCDPLILIAPNNEKYQAMHSAEEVIASLPGENFIVREEGSGTRKQSENFLANIGIDPASLSIVAQMDGTEGIIQAVYRGLGLSIISSTAAKDYIQSGWIISLVIDNEFLQRNLYLVYQKDRMLSPICEIFLHFIKNHYKREP